MQVNLASLNVRSMSSPQSYEDISPDFFFAFLLQFGMWK